MTYMDHYYKFNLRWFLQGIFKRNVYFYYDKMKECYVRQIDNVQGDIFIELYDNKVNKPEKRVMFVPNPNQLVNYKIFLA